MISVEDGKRAADEIAVMLKNMTPEQKIRSRDILTGITLIPPDTYQRDDFHSKLDDETGLETPIAL